MRIILNQGYEDKIPPEHKVEVSQETWDKAMEGFSECEKYHAANLAAHNWGVHLDGDRLICSSPDYSWKKDGDADGHVLNKNSGKRIAISSEEANALYPDKREYLYFES